MKERIVVFGSRGMLGGAVSQYFVRSGYEVLALSRKEHDITKEPPQDLQRFIAGPDVVINCAGIIKPRIAAHTSEDVYRVNCIFPRNLAAICSKLNVPCFHITTDCVYSGQKGNYCEEDLFDAEDLYGMSKNAGEDAQNSMVLRTSIIGEEFGTSRSLFEWVRSQRGQEVSGFLNHRWNGVTTLYLARIIAQILRDGLYQNGIFHVFSPQQVTKYELLELINLTYDLALSIKQVQASRAVDRTLVSLKPLAGQVCQKTLKCQLAEMREFFGGS